MPLILDGGLMPVRWAQNADAYPGVLTPDKDLAARCLRIAFVNNMPDSALEDTERQFFELLASAAAEVLVLVKLYALPEVPRGDRAKRHIHDFYCDVNDLWNREFDGIIVTGTEPKQANLREEPYWCSMANLFDWARQNTTSAILSCLAAHASVLHRDGISRCRLPDKQFGVFDFAKPQNHPLTNGTASVISIPHSRWNEVRAEDLKECGYTILTKSDEAGADLFVKETGKSLFIHFQGHPEYGTHTLMKEYRRDIRRYLAGERETYPTMPHGYVNAESTKLLNEFRENALTHRDEELLTLFPEAVVTEAVRNSWNSSAKRLYENWLQFLAFKKLQDFSSAVVENVPRPPTSSLPYSSAGNTPVLTHDRKTEF